MDILLQTRYKYKFEESIQEIKAEVNSHLKTKWYDLSIDKNIWGKFESEDTFTAKAKFFLPVNILGFSPPYAIIRGKLFSEQGLTIMHTTVRPSLLIVGILYFLLIFLVVKLLSLSKPINIDTLALPIAITFIFLTLFGITSYSMLRLRRRFEKLMRIKVKK